MAGWTVVLRGIRYRAGRSLVVLVLAAVATAATVLAPAYSRAAQQSVLTDGLTSAPTSATSLEVRSDPLSGAAPAAESVSEAKVDVRTLLARGPSLEAHFDPPVGGADLDTVLTGGREPVLARLAYRDAACRQLTITAGECPADAGTVMLSARSATEYGLDLGDTIDVRGKNVSETAPGTLRSLTIAGLYAPKNPNDPYWGRGGFFAAGMPDGESSLPRVDAVFAADEADITLPGALPSVYLDYRLRADTVRLDDVGRLRVDLASFETAVNGAQLQLSTALRGVLADIDADAAALGRTVPIVAVPLILLCWFVLFLLVAALTDERSPEIALAKLRGFSLRRAARFGRAEAVALILLAAPVGVVGGLGMVELAARSMLGRGVHVELRWPVLAAALLALLAAFVAIRLAGARTLARPVLALLRRVPERGRRRAGLVEGAIVALAAASLVAAVSDQTAPLALLAPALLAVVAGVIAARLLGLWSRMRVRSLARHGRVPALLAHAQLSRRPLGQRLIVVVTVAVALLSFAATAWDVAAQARRDVAADSVGADRVVEVGAAHPAALVAAVADADPDGGAMPVVRVTERYGNSTVELLGVQSDRLAQVAVWRGHDGSELADVAARLRTQQAPPLALDRLVRVDAAVGGLSGRLTLAAIVAPAGEPARTVQLGALVAGSRRYSAQLDGCTAGCRLLGLAISRAATGAGPVTAHVRIEAIATQSGPVGAGFEAAGRWRANSARAPRATVRVQPGAALTVELSSTDPGDVVVEYIDTPDVLPVVLAGATPADDEDATEFTFPAFGEQPQAFSVVGRESALPRVGRRGLLFDLDYAVRSAQRTSTLADNTRLNYEVWAGPQAPADLTARLAAAGLQIFGETSIDAELDQLSRGAPALGLRLYLIAGAAAVVLAVGAVLLTAYIGAQGRRYELAALRVAGVRPRVLRRGLRREYLHLLGLPLVIGLAAGVAGAALMLPGIPLVTVGTATGEITYEPGPGVLPIAVAVTVVGLLAAVVVVLRTVRRATPDRLREGWQ